MFMSMAGKKKEINVKISLETRMLSLTSEVLKESRNRIKIEGGTITITLPKEETEIKWKKMGIFRCKNTESGKIENPPLEEVLPPFQKWMDIVEFCQRDQRFGNLELLFSDEDTAHALSTNTIEGGK